MPFTSEAIIIVELGNKIARAIALKYAVNDLEVARVEHNFYIVSLVQCPGAICFHIDKTISLPL